MLPINSPDIIEHIKGLSYLSDYRGIRASLGGVLLRVTRYISHLDAFSICIKFAVFFYLFASYFVLQPFEKLAKNDGHYYDFKGKFNINAYNEIIT